MVTIDIVKRNISKINKEIDLFHQVSLGKTSKTKTRLSEFFRSKFKSSKYRDYTELETLTVAGSDYFVIRGCVPYVDTDGKTKYNEESIFISYPHLVIMKDFLKEIKEWLESEEYSDMFVNYEGSLILSDKYYNKRSSISLALDKTIVAFPTVLSEDNTYYEAVGLALNNKIDVFVTYDELCTLELLLTSINLYESSLQLLTIKNIYSSSGSSDQKQEKYKKSKETISRISQSRKRVTCDEEEIIL